MSSDQISEKPLPSGKKRCPYCGEVMSSTAETCWLCLEKFSIQEGAPQPDGRSRESAAPTQQERSSGDNLAWAFFGVLAIILCVGLAFAAPGVLVVLLILATPALIRTAMVMNRAPAQAAPAESKEEPPSVPSFLGIFLSSLGVTVMVGLLSFVAFFAAFCVVCFGGGALESHDKYGIPVHGLELLVAGVCVGLVPGLFVAIWLFRRLWRRKG